ncbi:MAG: 50S ribosomal protein L21 [Candidatus Eisenbacteria bacterium]
MFAIVESGGFQFRAQPGGVIDVPRIRAEVGEKVRLPRVLFLEGEDGSRVVGNPTVEGASAEAEVLAHGKGEKVLVQKFKRRKGYRRLLGQRACYTRIRVLSVER